MNIQFKKGVLELCVLNVLVKRDFYGYELVQHISQNIQISEGSIYPILRRLAKDGYVTTYLKESSGGPPRKYYSLTDLGKETTDELTKEWIKFVNGVSQIINGGDIE